MTKHPIENALSYFEASRLEKITLDFHSLQLTIELSASPLIDSAKNHQIVFEGISAFFFCNGEGEQRFKTDRKDWIELIELLYYTKDENYQMHISYRFDKPGTTEYNATPNFYLEMWDGMFVIEAKEIIIDGVKYKA